ncbi:hypothetical protein C8R45DRAFT_935353 [Mycena sanguinolenta]|nr:hypothetical protein C8R45DRAFT_935353 [Mycena sanguinolenta]
MVSSRPACGMRMTIGSVDSPQKNRQEPKKAIEIHVDRRAQHESTRYEQDSEYAKAVRARTQEPETKSRKRKNEQSKERKKRNAEKTHATKERNASSLRIPQTQTPHPYTPTKYVARSTAAGSGHTTTTRKGKGRTALGVEVRRCAAKADPGRWVEELVRIN